MPEVNYGIEIDRLNAWELTHPLSANAYKTLCKLLYLANLEHFPRRIQVPNTVLISMVGCSEDSLSRARNQLIQYGLIEYKGQKKLTPLYTFHYFSDAEAHNPSYNPNFAGIETHNPNYAGYDRENPKFAGINQGINRGINQGINQGINRGISAETYIDNINHSGFGEEEEEEDRNPGEEDIYNDDNREDGGPLPLYPPRKGEISQADRRALDGIRAWVQNNPEVKRTFGAGMRIVDQILASDRFPLELAGRAMELTLARNRKYAQPLGNPLAYMQKLLEDWERQGFETVQDIQEAKDDWALYGR